MFKYLLIPSEGTPITCGYKRYRTATLAENIGCGHAMRERLAVRYIDVVVLDCTPRQLENCGKPLAIRDIRIHKGV